MYLVYRRQNDGPCLVAEVVTREEASKYEPYLPMPTRESAATLANHLSNHTDWPKTACAICKPIKDASAAPAEEVPSGDLTSNAIRSAVERLKQRGKK